MECAKCSEVKLLVDFRHRDGHAIGVCKACESASALEYYYKNKEKVTSYKEKNKERFKARNHTYYEANKERHKASMSAWMAIHHDERRMAIREWQRKNPEKMKAARRKGARRATERLTDSVIANAYLRMNLVTAPPDMIELKREQIVLHRLAKELKQEIINQQENSNGN